jgi:hypothetical protein
MTWLTRACPGSKERKGSDQDQDDGSQVKFWVEDLFSVKGAQVLNLRSIEHHDWSQQIIKRIQLTPNSKTGNSNN